MTRNSLVLLFVASLAASALGEVQSLPLSQDASAPTHSLPVPEIFAPGVISGPGGDGSPTFSPDGNTIFFTRSAAHWTVILESHKVGGQWSRPTLAPFSGEWPESSPAMAPDGSYIVYQTSRRGPNGPVSELWRVDRAGSGWSKPVRLPDSVNIGTSIWKPSIAADGTIYLTHIDKDGNKRLFSARYRNGAYDPAHPLPFSDGATSDVDPEIAPDGSFLVFCSSGRLAGDTKDHLYIVHRQGDKWSDVKQVRYAGDDQKPDGFSTDDEPHLGPDHRTIYFTSDRSMTVHFPRTRDQAQQDFERMESWDNGNTNVWMISISSLL